MTYEKLIEGMKRYGANEKDICVNGIGIEPEQVQEHVVLAPWWEPESMPDLGDMQCIRDSGHGSVKVWTIQNSEMSMTYIRTGIGAPVLMDALLSLGVTKCQKVIFVGSVGALDEKMEIGDIVIPEYSVCGDGASRYLAAETLRGSDVFGEKAFPDRGFTQTVLKHTEEQCSQRQARYHTGINFSVDTVFAQFNHLDEIMGMGCNTIEMETAAAFRAAEIAGLSIAAIFSVSDNTMQNKSLISGRSEKDHAYRWKVRRELFPQIILNAFRDAGSQGGRGKAHTAEK